MILTEILNDFIRSVITIIVDDGNDNYAIPSQEKNSPRPIGPYSSVSYQTDTGIGWEESVFEDRMDGMLDQTISRQSELMFSLNFFRDGAHNNARKVRTAMVRESIQQLFSDAGVGLASRSAVRNISFTLEDTWEERSQFDIVVNAVGTDTDIVQSIETVLMNLTVETNGNSYNTDIEA